MNKLSIKIILGLLTKTEIINLISIRHFGLCFINREKAMKEICEFMNSKVSSYWKRKYILNLKKKGIRI